MKTRTYRVMFTVEVDLPEEEESLPKAAIRAAKFKLTKNGLEALDNNYYPLVEEMEYYWRGNYDTPVRRWDKYGREKPITSDTAHWAKWRREQAAQEAKAEAEKLAEQAKPELEPGIAP